MKKLIIFVLTLGFSAYATDLFKEELPQSILKSGALEKLDLENYYSYEQKLIENLQNKIIRQINTLNIDKNNPKEIAALFLAHNVVILNAALYAATNIANKDIYGSYTNKSLNSSLNEKLNSKWKFAAYAAKYAADKVGKKNCEKAWYKSRKKAKLAISEASQSILSRHGEKMDKKRCGQASLFVLAFIAQESFLKDHFVKAYDNILEALKSQPEFLLTTIGTLGIIENEIWNNREQSHLASNPFAQSLRSIIYSL